MAINTGTLIEDFVSFVQDRIEGAVVIAEDTDGGTRPSKDSEPKGFTSCKVRSLVGIGSPEYSDVDSNGAQTIKVQREILIDLQSFGPNAMGRLDCLKIEFSKRSIKSKLKDICLVFVDASDVLSLSTVLDTDWEERAQMTMRLRGTNVISDDGVGIVENVSLTENYNDCDGNTVRTVQSNITSP